MFFVYRKLMINSVYSFFHLFSEIGTWIDRSDLQHSNKSSKSIRKNIQNWRYEQQRKHGVKQCCDSNETGEWLFSKCFFFFFGTIKRFQIQLPSLSFSTLFVLKFYQLRLFFLSCFSLDFKCERCKLVCGFLHCF